MQAPQTKYAEGLLLRNYKILNSSYNNNPSLMLQTVNIELTTLFQESFTSRHDANQCYLNPCVSSIRI